MLAIEAHGCDVDRLFSVNLPHGCLENDGVLQVISTIPSGALIAAKVAKVSCISAYSLLAATPASG